MTDIQKFILFLEEMNIKFEMINKSNYFRLCIDEKHLDQNQYSPSLDIVFDKNGKFSYFETYGE